MAIKQQASFSRTRDNEAKMGAYYTDLDHCRDIHSLLRFPEDQQVCVLEPSIGDGSAVITVTGAQSNPNIQIFGVELNDTVARRTGENEYIREVLRADFTDGVSISKNCFSFCFGNPPYIREDMEEMPVRMEKLFLEKVIPLMKKDGILVWIVSHSVFMEHSYLRTWLQNFHTEAIYKFRPKEFAKRHQIAIIGRKKVKEGIINDQVKLYQSKMEIEKIQELPVDGNASISVPPSEASEITRFTSIIFNSEKAYEILEERGLSLELKKTFNTVASAVTFQIGSLGRPPIPLKKDSLYLLATSGGGQGLTGSEEKGDLHLQRGTAEILEEEFFLDDGTIRVTSSTKIQMTIIENNGDISKMN